LFSRPCGLVLGAHFKKYEVRSVLAKMEMERREKLMKELSDYNKRLKQMEKTK
jgi:hypothetical protein